MTGIICALAGGASSRPVLDTQTVVPGIISGGFSQLKGYRRSPVLGSITDGSSNLYGGALINNLLYFIEYDSTYGFITSNWVQFIVAGVRSNSGWSTMEANGIIYPRASATFTTTSTTSTWQWTVGVAGGGTAGPDPFTSPAVFRWY